MLDIDNQQPTTNNQQPVSNAARRVAINTVSPFVAQVVTKVLMLGYNIVQFRLVAGEALGSYILATIVFSYTSTVSEWGLTTLVARDVAKARGTEREAEEASALFAETLTLRLLISLALFVPVGVFAFVYALWFKLSAEGAWAVAILTISLLPSAFSGAVTALLYAYERMSLPAGIGVITSIANIAIGSAALLLGWGIIGLAVAAMLTTLLTAAIFLYVLRRNFPGIAIRVSRVGLRLDRRAAGGLLSAGWPLMLNALLVGLFFRADQFIIQANQSPLEVARYEAAYRFLNFVLIITPAVTLALFPRMSRHAASDRPRLAYEYGFALKVMMALAIPIVGLTVWFAPLLIAIVTGGKPGYLPNSAMALQILIFFLPFSFINGVTQYVLIALDRQRLITKAFVATVVFNVVSNLVLVPALGINGAAIATILSELVLLGPFLVWTHRETGVKASLILGTGLKPLVAGSVAAGAGWLLWPFFSGWENTASWAGLPLYLGAGLLLAALYGLVVVLLRPFTGAELATLRGALRRGRS